MKTAPVFRGKRVDNGIVIEGIPVSSVNDRLYMIVYATEDAVNTQNEVDFLFIEVDPATIEQIGGDLFEENKRLNELVEMKSGTIELWKEEYAELKSKLAQAEETADHFRGRAEELNKRLKETK